MSYETQVQRAQTNGMVVVI